MMLAKYKANVYYVNIGCMGIGLNLEGLSEGKVFKRVANIFARNVMEISSRKFTTHNKTLDNNYEELGKGEYEEKNRKDICKILFERPEIKEVTRDKIARTQLEKFAELLDLISKRIKELFQ